MNFIKAAILHKLNTPLKIIEDVEIPALKEGQLLVKIKYAGLCHSQLMEAKGLRGEDKYLPHMLGHEGVGEIIDIGPKSKKFVVGDQVVLGWVKGLGLEGGPTKYKSQSLGTVNAGAVTTFSNYAVISENRLYKKPKGTPEKLAVLYGCALPTGVGLVLNDLKPKKDACIVVLGLGGIGLSALMACKKFLPKTLIAIDTEPAKLELAKELGATHTINIKDENLKDIILSLTNNNGSDYCIEAAGLVSTIETGFALIRRNGGELIFASHPKAGDMISLDPFELICGKSIRGTWGGSSQPDHDIEILGEMYRNGQLQLEKMLSHEYNLDNINKAMDDLQNKKIVRALITME